MAKYVCEECCAHYRDSMPADMECRCGGFVVEAETCDMCDGRGHHWCLDEPCEDCFNGLVPVVLS